MSPTQSKEHAYELINRMTPGQVAAVVGLLEVMLDPLAPALSNALFNDELVSEEETENARAAFNSDEKLAKVEPLSSFGSVKLPEEKMDWEQFFLIPGADIPQELAVAAAIDGRGDR